MKHLRHYLLLCLFWATALTASAQQPFWKPATETAAGKNLFAGQSKPSAYKLFQLDEKAFLIKVRTAPSEKTIAAKQSDFVLSFPDEKGELQQYRVVDAPVMEPALAAKYPGIRSYAGVSVSDPTTLIRFSVSPQGMQGMILSSKKPTVYIEPLADNYYMVVSAASQPASTEPFICYAEERISQAASTAQRNADDGKLRTYRLALCASGEFSAYWLNGTEQNDAERKAKVLTAQVNLVTRANGVFETDFGMRLLLVANNDAVIYLNPSTDPFTENVGDWNTQTAQACNDEIGFANYDVGHLLNRLYNIGGAASDFGNVCTWAKAGGWTSLFNVAGPHILGIFMHELGHQFGAYHTYSFRYDGPIGQYEPGSGSTIMSYAGATGPATDVQLYRDLYFHATSIEYVTNYIKSVVGNCGVSIVTGNSPPTVNAGADYFIPRSTPFMLTGKGNDADGDPLLYNWEQMDLRTAASPPVPDERATEGPLFRSFTPADSSFRVFPALEHILNGSNTTRWEVLPAVGRTLNFRFTAREIRAGGSNNKSDDVVLTVDSSTGPFLVTAPNTAVTWLGNSLQSVNWSVNGTNAPPVNCANVKISFSIDGGINFSTLIASTPNDGTEVITVPAIITSKARIKVEAADNIFFDISNTDITISAPIPSTCHAAYEPNNTHGTAIKIQTGTNYFAGITSSTDIDYFWGQTTMAGQVVFSLTTPAATYYEMKVYNINNVLIGAVSGASATKTITLNNSAYAAYYYIRIMGVNGPNNPNCYLLRMEETGNGNCPGVYDNSTNNTMVGAAQIIANRDAYGRVYTPGDDDYYSVFLTNGGTTEITLSDLPADYDLMWYSISGTQLAASSTRGYGDETLSGNFAQGYYYILVKGYNGASNASHCYKLRVQQAAATKGQEVELIIATTDEKAGSKINVFPNPVRNTLHLAIPNIKGIAMIRVFDMYGKMVLQKSTAQANTAMDISRLSSGIYIIRVMNDGREEVVKIVKE